MINPIIGFAFVLAMGNVGILLSLFVCMIAIKVNKHVK